MARPLDETQNNFNLVTKRLNGSMIKLLTSKTTQYISVFNPSVNDYLKLKFQSAQVSDFIIRHSLFIDQQIKVIQNIQSKEYIRSFLEEYEFNKREKNKNQ